MNSQLVYVSLKRPFWGCRIVRKRISLTEEQLERVTELRARGLSWSEVGRQLGVHRLIVQREHRNWEALHGQVRLREIRREVAAEEFKRHLHQVVSLAAALRTVIEWVLTEPHWLGMDDPFTTRVGQAGSLSFLDDDPLATVDHAQRKRSWAHLYESLQKHLAGVEWREREKEWGRRRRRCATLHGEWEMEALQRLDASVSAVALRYKLDLQGQERERLVDELIKLAWQTLVSMLTRDVARGMNEAEQSTFVHDLRKPLLSAIATAQAPSNHGWSLDIEGKEFLAGISDEEMAKAVREACVNGLTKTLSSPPARHALMALQDVKQASDSLSEVLEPLKLRPLLLRTQCSLCPA